MSTTDPRKSVLERLRDREKNRDWTVLNKSYPAPHGTRRWSAESYRGEQFVSSRKPPSPRQLPTLDARPASVDSDYDWDLKHRSLTVIPPVTHVKLNGDFRSDGPSLPYQPRDQRVKGNYTGKELGRHEDYTRQTHPHLPPYNNNNNSSYPTMAPPPHPPQMYPVPMMPMYPGYVPWFMPQFGFTGATNGAVNGQQHGYYGAPARPARQISRSKAVTILQKYTRGWLVRKSQKFASWRYMCNRKHGRRVVESLIHNFLREEIIPDILIEVLSHKTFLSVQDPRYQVSDRVCREILNQDVTAFIQDTAIGVFYSYGAGSYSRRDPVFRVAADIVNEVVNEAADHIVRVTIQGVVFGHMTVSKTGDWLEDFILETMMPMLPRVASEAIQQYRYDEEVYGIVDDVITPYLRQVIGDAWRDVVEVDRNEQLSKVRVYAEGHMLDSMCLQHLLSQLAGDNLSLYFGDYMDQVLDGVICGLLTQQYLAVENEREATQSNSVVEEWHQDIFCDLALDVLIEELTGHLDEDIQDLTEHEKEKSRFEL